MGAEAKGHAQELPEESGGEAGAAALQTRTEASRHLRLQRAQVGAESCAVACATPSPRLVESLPIVAPSRYRIAQEHARGGLGRILRAHDDVLDRPLVIKELLARGPAAELRFLREATLTARLCHPGIIAIHDAGRWPNGRPFYAMKMVPGRSMKAAIAACSNLAERLELLPNVASVAEAIAYAHSRGVIHRDLKPSNVMVGAHGETVVIDWGLAKDLQAGAISPERPAARGLDETAAGTVLGTPGYMPPEQARGRVVDERADVYSIGAILYHLLCGRPPYTGATSAEIIAAVTTGPPPPVERQQRGVPRALVLIVNKAMAREPDDRYASARELAADLRRVQAERLAPLRRTRPLAVTLAFAVVLVAACFLAFQALASQASGMPSIVRAWRGVATSRPMDRACSTTRATSGAEPSASTPLSR